MNLRRLSTYDLFERHEVTSRLLSQHLASRSPISSLLDVGGRRGLLSDYLPTSMGVTTLNPDGSADINGSGSTLPFRDDTFDAVVTLDTLEHMPKYARLPFLSECLRVSRRLLLVAAPYGSVHHIQRERSLNERFRIAHGYYHEYLNEHVLYGLPSADEIETFRKLTPISWLYYAGDFQWQADAFERTLHTASMPRIAALPINAIHMLASTALLHRIRLRTSPDPSVNRFYLVLTK